MAANVAGIESIGSEVETCSDNPGGVMMDHSLPLTDTSSDHVAVENLSKPSEQDQQRHHHHPVQEQQRSSLELESQQQQPDREAVDSIEIGVDTDSNPEIVMDDHSLPLTDTSDNVVETRAENIELKLSELGQQQLQQNNPLLDQQLRHGKKPQEIQDAALHRLATPKQPGGEQSQQQQPDGGGVKSMGIGIETGLNSELVMVPSLSSMEDLLHGPSALALPRPAILVYGTGHVLNDLTAACWFTYLLIFLTDVGLSPKQAGAVMLSGQVADGFATILVGQLSSPDSYVFWIHHIYQDCEQVEYCTYWAHDLLP
ncbi:unnamed protein product [Calypogeia fissa]